jgi:cobalt-zinc-cadmium efflux system outer membrane protein
LEAPNTPDLPQPMTLAALEELALANNPTVGQAAAVVEAARGRLIQAGLYPNPVVGYNGGEIGNNGAAGQQGGFVMQEFVTAGKLQLDQAVAEHRLEQLDAEFEAARVAVLGAVRTQFYDVLARERAVEIAQELQQIAAGAVRSARELFQAGQGTRSDLLLAEIEASKAGIALENARNLSVNSWRRLAAVVGVPSLAPTDLEGSLEDGVPELDWETVLYQLHEQSPEIQRALGGVPRALDALRRAQVEPIPNLRLQAMVQHDASSRDTITSVQLGVAIPLFDRNQGNIRAAHAEVQRARQEVQRVELLLQHRLAQAFQRYETARQQVETYRGSVLPKAQESLELTTEGYRRQQFDFLQLLTAQRTYFETRLAYVESLAELRKSAVAIESLLLTEGLERDQGLGLRD